MAMILIRGIKGEAYARKIERGLVDCRDILSALLEPPVTGYAFSDYYEKNLVKALCYYSNIESAHLRDPAFLHSLLIDYYIPHIYLTYFHILNDNSIAWLDNFDEDYRFIAINVKLDKLTNSAIGIDFFGARMSYVDSIREVEQEGYSPVRAACMCALEGNFPNKIDMSPSLAIYNTLCFPLLYRERDGKFTDIENEFRIIAFDCPVVRGEMMRQRHRKILLRGKSGTTYYGALRAKEEIILQSDLRVLRNPTKTLRDILVEENGVVTLSSKFKSIDIRTVSDEYKYIGTKDDCRSFIEENLKKKQQDVFIEKTIQRTYEREMLKKCFVSPGYLKVEY